MNNPLIIFTTRRLGTESGNLFSLSEDFSDKTKGFKTKKIAIGDNLKKYWLKKAIDNAKYQSVILSEQHILEITFRNRKGKADDYDNKSIIGIIRREKDDIVDNVDINKLTIINKIVESNYKYLYQIKGENVFAYYHLENTVGSVENESIPFLKAIYEDVKANTHIAFDGVLFFVHGGDIGVDEYYHKIEGDIPTKVKQGLGINEDVEVYAFKHESSSLIFEILSEFRTEGYQVKIENDETVAEHIYNRVARVEQIYEDIKQEEKQFAEAYTISNDIESNTNIGFYEIQEIDNKLDKKTVEEKSKYIGLKKYVVNSVLNNSKFTHLKGNGEEKVSIWFISMSHIKKTSRIDNKDIFQLISEENKYEKRKQYQPKPIIIIGLYDIVNEETLSVEVKNKFKYLYLDKRRTFLDSSIWQIYLTTNNKNTFENNLKEVLSTIEKRLELKLYQTNVAREYCELYSRWTAQHYLAPVGGHATNVQPLSFHSESDMERKAKKLLTEFENKGLRWNFLLVDDFANCGLTINHLESMRVFKKDLIKCLIGSKIVASEQIDYSEFIKDGIKKLKGSEDTGTIYDVILLDYLFSKNHTPTAYGTELLKEINNSDFKGQKGPFERYWIFPVTVFSRAMSSSLRAEGTPHISEHWYLAEGADPINTPQLFRYNLYKFLELQIKEVTYTRSEIFSFFTQRGIPVDGSHNQINADDWARENFLPFMAKYANIELLNRSKKGTSTFLETMSTYLNKDIEAREVVVLVEYIRQLMYLLAYGTGYDSSMMLEELKQIKNKLKNSNSVAPSIKQEANKELDKIRRFILDISDLYK